MEHTKTFVLGVGAAKAGTTWLWDYLNSRPDSDMGFLKEYLVFDVLDEPITPWARNLVFDTARAALDAGVEGLRQRKRQIKRLAFIADDSLYFDYFLARLSQPGTRLTGDITPTYSALSERRLARIRDQLRQRGIAAKPVFLMRDPLDRMQSHVRMFHKNRKLVASLDEEVAAMRTMMASPLDRWRADYSGTIRRLDAVFGTEVFYGFFEELFRPESIAALCRFLEVPFAEASYGVHKNVSATDNALPEELRQELAGHYREVYRFVSDRFGAERIAALWPTAALA